MTQQPKTHTVVPGLTQSASQRKKAQKKRSKGKKTASNQSSTGTAPATTASTATSTSLTTTNQYEVLSDTSDTSDAELEHHMEGVNEPSKPNSLYASHHVPGADVADDDGAPTDTAVVTGDSATESTAMDSDPLPDQQPAVVITEPAPDASTRTWADVACDIMTTPLNII